MNIPRTLWMFVNQNHQKWTVPTNTNNNSEAFFTRIIYFVQQTPPNLSFRFKQPSPYHSRFKPTDPLVFKFENTSTNTTSPDRSLFKPDRVFSSKFSISKIVLRFDRGNDFFPFSFGFILCGFLKKIWKFKCRSRSFWGWFWISMYVSDRGRWEESDYVKKIQNKEDENCSDAATLQPTTAPEHLRPPSYLSSPTSCF